MPSFLLFIMFAFIVYIHYFHVQNPLDTSVLLPLLCSLAAPSLPECPLLSSGQTQGQTLLGEIAESTALNVGLSGAGWLAGRLVGWLAGWLLGTGWD